MDTLREILDALKGVFNDYAVFIGMSAMSLYGGIVSYIHAQREKGLALRCSELALDALSSLFVGMLVGMLVLSFVNSPILACALSGYAGHEGTRKIFRMLNPKIRKVLK